MIVLGDATGPHHFSQDNMLDRGYQSAPQDLSRKQSPF
jgi:hypothetical protein